MGGGCEVAGYKPPSNRCWAFPRISISAYRGALVFGKMRAKRRPSVGLGVGLYFLALPNMLIFNGLF
jgi:hypothetical protein